MKRHVSAICMVIFLTSSSWAEDFRTVLAGKLDIQASRPEGTALSLGWVDSAIITLSGDTRFLKGVEFEIKASTAWLKYRGSLAVAFYGPVAPLPTQASGTLDVSAERLGFELLSNKLQSFYQIPLRKGHGLKTTPYATVPTAIVPVTSFPIIVRIMPVVKGLSEDISNLTFELRAKPLFSDEGAVKVHLRYPEKLKEKPLTLRIDDQVIDNLHKEVLLPAGEHHLAVVSDDFRNESRQFLVERAVVTDLTIELQDPAPQLIFEAPENAQIYFDGIQVANPREPFKADPGEHELKMLIGDYSIMQRITLRKGYTYRATLPLEIIIHESE